MCDIDHVSLLIDWYCQYVNEPWFDHQIITLLDLYYVGQMSREVLLEQLTILPPNIYDHITMAVALFFVE